jgi:hypothetical protein
MNTVPSLITRATNHVDLMIKQDVNVLRYRVRGHRTLNGAQFGSVAMFVADSGRHYRSVTLRQKGIGVVEDSKRDMTRITFDPADFQATSPSLPSDGEVLFLRVEEFSVATGGYLPPGQILIVPPAETFGVQDSTITVAGIAPGGLLGAIPGSKPPPESLSFGLPLYSTSATISNLDANNNLLISFNEGMPMVVVKPNDEIVIPDGSVVEVFVASQAVNAVEFSMFFTLTKV